MKDYDPTGESIQYSKKEMYEMLDGNGKAALWTLHWFAQTGSEPSYGQVMAGANELECRIRGVPMHDIPKDSHITKEHARWARNCVQILLNKNRPEKLEKGDIE